MTYNIAELVDLYTSMYKIAGECTPNTDIVAAWKFASVVKQRMPTRIIIVISNETFEDPKRCAG